MKLYDVIQSNYVIQTFKTRNTAAAYCRRRIAEYRKRGIDLSDKLMIMHRDTKLEKCEWCTSEQECILENCHCENPFKCQLKCST